MRSRCQQTAHVSKQAPPEQRAEAAAARHKNKSQDAAAGKVQVIPACSTSMLNKTRPTVPSASKRGPAQRRGARHPAWGARWRRHLAWPLPLWRFSCTINPSLSVNTSMSSGGGLLPVGAPRSDVEASWQNVELRGYTPASGFAVDGSGELMGTATRRRGRPW
jgi:hypothetical protein